MSDRIEDPEAKTAYIARASDGSNFIVIAEHDGSFRRWKLSDLLVIKIAREGTDLALDIAARSQI